MRLLLNRPAKSCLSQFVYVKAAVVMLVCRYMRTRELHGHSHNFMCSKLVWQECWCACAPSCLPRWRLTRKATAVHRVSFCHVQKGRVFCGEGAFTLCCATC